MSDEHDPGRAVGVTVAVLFALSGVVSLSYQVVWTRLLRDVMGSTAHAVGAVLAAYMSGMALGSLVFGRLADAWRRPVLLFALLEGAVAISALSVPPLTAAAGGMAMHAYRPGASGQLGLVLLRYGLTLVVLLVPTTLMGGTLPALATLAATRGTPTRGTVSGLYAVNTLGAAAGAVIAGFLSIRFLGVRASNAAAAGASLCIAAVAAAVDVVRRRRESDAGSAPVSTAPAGPSAPRSSGSAALALGLGIGGAAAFCFEICWTRALVSVFGSSTYAFSAMLAVLLLGLATGSAIVRQAARRSADPLLLYGRIEIGVGLAVAGLYLALTATFFTPAVQRVLLDRPLPWPTLLALQVGASILTVFGPSVLIGATFPLAAEIEATEARATGRRVGRLAAANTTGNVVGALCASLLLVPGIGVTRTILAASAATALVGLAFVAARMAGAGRAKAPASRPGHGVPWNVGFLATAAAVVVAAVLLGVRPLAFQLPSDTQEPGDRVLYYREGLEATTKVYAKQDSDERHMSVDGTYIGGSGGTEQKEIVLAHLPKLLLERYDAELSIGLGSGILAGESALHPELTSLTCVEIEPTVVEGARLFDRENRGLFGNPRVDVLVDDGLAYLRAAPEQVSIVTSDEKSRPRSRGNGLFLSADYYRLLLAALEPGGLAIQWVPLHVPPEAYRTILRTFCASFPCATLWYFSDLDTFLVGSKKPLRVDAERIARLLGNGDAASPYASLRRYGLRDAPSVVSALVASKATIAAAVGAGTLNTFDRPVIEFYPFADYAEPVNATIAENLGLVLRLFEAVGAPPEVEPSDTALADACTRAREATVSTVRALRAAYELSQDVAGIEALLAQATARAPDAARVRYTAARYDVVRARARIASGSLGEAARYLRQATAAYPEGSDGWYFLSYVQSQSGDAAAAMKSARVAAALSPESPQIRRTLFYLLLGEGRLEDAVGELRLTLRADPDDLFALRTVGLYEAEKRGDAAASLPYFQRALQIDPGNAEVRGFLAWWSYRAGEVESARRVVREGGSYYRGSATLTAQRQMILR